MKTFEGDVYFLNTTQDDFEGHGPRTAHRGLSYVGSRSPVAEYEGYEDTISRKESYDTTLTLHQLSLVPSAKEGDSTLFEFFVTSICPNLSSSETENPYREFIIPLSLSCAPLYHAILSWAATEVSFTNHARKDAYAVVAADYKGRALKGLREAIEAAQGSAASGDWSSVLTTIIILSANDIAETCSQAWVEHLSAARVLCHMVWGDRPATHDRFRRFVVMWFTSHDIMSRTAWVRKTLFDPSEWFAGDDEAEVDPIIACSRGVIQQVSAIGALIMESRSPMSGEGAAALSARRDAIEGRLHSLHQRVSGAGDGTGELLQVAESKRLCALIYLYACIDNATPASPVIQGLTRRVMRILAGLPARPSIIFSLFVVGTLGVCSEGDRRLVLDKFHSLIKMRCLATAIKARDVAVNVWLDRDLGRYGRWEDLVETKSKLLSLA